MQVQGAFQGAKDSTKDSADRVRARAPSSHDVEGQARSALDSAEDTAIRAKHAPRLSPLLA